MNDSKVRQCCHFVYGTNIHDEEHTRHSTVMTGNTVEEGNEKVHENLLLIILKLSNVLMCHAQ